MCLRTFMNQLAYIVYILPLIFMVKVRILTFLIYVRHVSIYFQHQRITTPSPPTWYKGHLLHYTPHATPVLAPDRWRTKHGQDKARHKHMQVNIGQGHYVGRCAGILRSEGRTSTWLAISERSDFIVFTYRRRASTTYLLLPHAWLCTGWEVWGFCMLSLALKWLTRNMCCFYIVR